MPLPSLQEEFDKVIACCEANMDGLFGEYSLASALSEG
jgi:hypothetical protein